MMSRTSEKLLRLEPLAEAKWRLAQVPRVEGALVAVDPQDAAIKALVGGFDFARSKFNRAAQALRQPGSSLKPFIYSAALNKGFTPASIINDAPIVFEGRGLQPDWRPENYSGRFFGPTRLRVALTHSRNLVSIRLLQAIGVDYALDYLRRFGFHTETFPHNLSLALGTAEVTPLEMASAYAVFANGGYRVEQHLIDRVEDEMGNVLYVNRLPRACSGAQCWRDDSGQSGAQSQLVSVTAAASPRAPSDAEIPEQRADTPVAQRVVEAQNIYLMTSMMRDVIRLGTGRRAMQLGRGDLAGKTGTTNDQRDAWFAGFNDSVVSVAWVGFDQPRPLGNQETGGRAALPMWMEFMAEALKGQPEQPLRQPPGLVAVRIDPQSGLLAGAGQADAVFEMFPADRVPHRSAEPSLSLEPGTHRSADAPTRPEQLF